MDQSNVAPLSGSSATQNAVRPLPRSRIAAHGLDNRGLEAASPPGAGIGRFGRMFPVRAGDLSDDCLQAIAKAMIKEGDPGVKIDVAEAVDENPRIPSGYTYFGQFVDHDLSLDATSLRDRNVDVAAIENFRTPALDLDCIYGRGPDDQPYLYEADGLHLRLGKVLKKPLAKQVQTRRDVLRLHDPNGQPAPAGKGPNPAILGDKRNDENRIVVQLQSAFISFHNKVVGDQALIEAFGGVWVQPGSRFRTAMSIVRWHYQWLVLHDYLDRVLAPTALSDILRDGEAPSLPNYQKPTQRWAYMPVEFSGAAYRFGHSMVRPGYALNNKIGADNAKGTTGDEDTSPQPKHRIAVFSDAPPLTNLNGFGFELPDDWGIDWAFFFDGLEHAHIPAGFKVPQLSYRLDAQLVDPLSKLPEFRGQPDIVRNLAYRNLVRGAANLRLPSGEQVADLLRIKPLPPEVLWSAGSRSAYKPTAAGGWTRLSDAELTQKLGADDFGEMNETQERRDKVLNAWVVADGQLKGNTPLWYYILREAEFFGDSRKPEGATGLFGGQHLGPVGSRIVGETFVGLLWNDETSVLRSRPGFEPHPRITGGAAFTVGTLLKYALT